MNHSFFVQHYAGLHSPQNPHGLINNVDPATGVVYPTADECVTPAGRRRMYAKHLDMIKRRRRTTPVRFLGMDSPGGRAPGGVAVANLVDQLDGDHLYEIEQFLKAAALEGVDIVEAYVGMYFISVIESNGISGYRRFMPNFEGAAGAELQRILFSLLEDWGVDIVHVDASASMTLDVYGSNFDCGINTIAPNLSVHRGMRMVFEAIPLEPARDAAGNLIRVEHPYGAFAMPSNKPSGKWMGSGYFCSCLMGQIRKYVTDATIWRRAAHRMSALCYEGGGTESPLTLAEAERWLNLGIRLVATREDQLDMIEAAHRSAKAQRQQAALEEIALRKPSYPPGGQAQIQAQTSVVNTDGERRKLPDPVAT